MNRIFSVALYLQKTMLTIRPQEQREKVSVIAAIILSCGCALLPEMPERKPVKEQQLI